MSGSSMYTDTSEYGIGNARGSGNSGFSNDFGRAGGMSAAGSGSSGSFGAAAAPSPTPAVDMRVSTQVGCSFR